MSQTYDTPILDNSITNRDKLLSLAELASSSNKNKKKPLKSRFQDHTSIFSSTNKKSPNLDLSYTENIEHLVNNYHNNHRGHKVILRTNENFSPENISKNDISSDKISCDSSHQRLIDSDSSVLNCMKYPPSPTSKIDSETLSQHESRIPRCNRQLRTNRCSDLYSKYYEFRQKNLGLHLDNESKPLLRMKSDHSKSSMISTVTLKANNITFIPIFNQRLLNQGKIDTSRFSNKSISMGKVYDRSESSSNCDQINSKNNAGPPYQESHSKNNNDGDKEKISQFFNHINTFIMDEENYTNSPKKILSNELFPKKDLFNCDHFPTETVNLKNHDLLEKLFLTNSQKNSVFIINGNLESNKIPETVNKNNKSSSCDNLDDIKFKLNDKFKSENDLTINKNDLSRISHLEEEISEQESVINRFRKKFSIHSRSGQSPKSTPNSNSNSFSVESNLMNNDKSNLQQYSEKVDINRNKIDSNDIKKYLLLNGKLSPRETRKFTFNRKSLRKTSRKHARLKRSHTQPFENQMDECYDESETKLVDSLNNHHEDSEILSTHSPCNDILDENHQNNVIYAEAIFDYSGTDNEELSFRAGDLIEVTDTSHKQWWWGAIKTCDETRYGWFPATYVRLKVSQEETIEESLENAEQFNDMSNSQMRTSISKLSSEQVRANVVLEIINTERDFVKNLKDVIDGYLKPCRDRKDMFDEARISTIFGNIEELFQFQSQFLSQLEQCIDMNNLSQSRIGNCFLENEKGFAVYSEFCKNHPLATSELQDLYSDHKYVIFFEGCRLLQNMIDISLDGFLLTPIQKICKYPLQLAELLKYTKSDHCDYIPVSDAYKCMQRVAQMVNERKSRFESLEKLLSLQESFENWDGPPLLDTSSLLIHSGEISRVTRSSWSKELTLFLFDHLLILAKKDTRILKKRAYLFKTRINLDHIDPIIPLEDNIKDSNFNILTKNAFKFFYRPKQKWYLFQAKSLEEKESWIKAFEQEKNQTKEDEEQGFIVTEQDKKGAQMAHQNNLKPKKPKIRKPNTKIKKPDTVIAEIPLGPLKGFEIDRNRAGSLPSYIHQEKHLINLYKNRQSTFHKKTRSNWFQLGSNKKNRIKRNLK